MEFYTSSKYKRPIRLSEETRRFAYDSLNHKYGLDTDKTPNVDVSHIENYKNLSPLERYNLGVYEIVTKAPLRICDGGTYKRRGYAVRRERPFVPCGA